MLKQLLKNIVSYRNRRRLMKKVTLIGTEYDKYLFDLHSSVSLRDGSTSSDIILEDNVWMFGSLASQSGGKIIMHKFSRLGDCSSVTCVDKVEIGAYTTISNFVWISDNNNHPVNPSYRKYMRVQSIDDDSRLWKHSVHAPVIIGENCWIGRNVSIMKGVHIGDNTVIAANSVVTKDIPANCIAAGNPAKVVKTEIENIPAPTTCGGYNKYIQNQK